jgi:23S rRNA pseudouridine1911/1915/1917 synthase
MSAPLVDQPTIPVLYDDEHLLVVDKPARCLVVAAPGRRGATAVDRVGRQRGERVYAVHRLDEDTTGVLVLARTEASREALEQVFRRHEAQRVYLALASRVPSPAAGRIESRLAVGRDGVVRSVTGRGGELAVTRFRTLERRDRHALLECELETGRRNQIRVHLSELGCPLVGDRKYGWRSRGSGGPDRPLLHAWRIRFVHTITGAVVDVGCDPTERELRPGPAKG